ncbi:MAG: flavodoxin family protein [Deltaproteobacteria bacterium]|nr:flavodoxin family protein [Deltaproteobacteria bacterium]
MGHRPFRSSLCPWKRCLFEPYWRHPKSRRSHGGGVRRPRARGLCPRRRGLQGRQGRADQETLAFFARAKDKKTAFFFTLGDYPDGASAGRAADIAIKILEDNGNAVLGHSRRQGKVDP